MRLRILKITFANSSGCWESKQLESRSAEQKITTKIHSHYVSLIKWTFLIWVSLPRRWNPSFFIQKLKVINQNIIMKPALYFYMKNLVKLRIWKNFSRTVEVLIFAVNRTRLSWYLLSFSPSVVSDSACLDCSTPGFPVLHHLLECWYKTQENMPTRVFHNTILAHWTLWAAFLVHSVNVCSCKAAFTFKKKILVYRINIQPHF